MMVVICSEELELAQPTYNTVLDSDVRDTEDHNKLREILLRI